MPDRCPIDFDHHSAEFAARPWETLAAIRGDHPVAWTEAHGGYWVVASYDAVYEAAHDAKAFSSRHDEPYGTAAAGGASAT